MDQFADRLANLAEAADDELATLEQDLVTAFDAADNAGDIEQMSQIADALDAVRAEKQRRTEGTPEEAAEAAEEMDEVVAASAEVEETEAGTETETEEPAPVTETEGTEAEAEAADTEVEGEPPADDSSTTDAEPAETGDGETTEAEASAEQDSQEENVDQELTAGDVSEDASPETVTAAAPPVVIRAGGDIPGVPAGSEMASLDDVAEAMAARINALKGTGGDGERVVVASLASTVSDDSRTLRRSDPIGNGEKIRQVQESVDALTAAANGWCAPRTPMYNIFGVGSNERPVQNSLPGFNADRGGITWTAPPALADASYGVGKWSWVTDAWKGSATVADGALAAKVSFTPTCPGELSADLQAITTQLKFDTLAARAFPENVRRNMELAQIAHARFAESALLGKMWAAADAVANDNTSIDLGAARDYLFTLRVLAVSFRNRHRMSADVRLDAWAPAWLRDAIALDLMEQMPGDDKFQVALNEIEQYVANANVNVTWYLDDVPGASVSQLFTSVSAFPTSAATILAPAGSFLYLDGGTLDIGVVRDSSLVGTNEYVEFSETFEGLAFVGVEALKFETAVKIAGGTAAGVDTSAGVVLGA